MKTKTNHGRLKFGVAFFGGISLVVFAVNAWTVTIPSNISNALQVIQRLLITSDGTQSGTPVMDINTGGSIIVYSPLVDANANPYLTGYTETDPVRLAQKAGYYTKAQIDGQSFLTSENDPFWTVEKSWYYSKLDIDAKWYLTWFTEIDSVFLWSDAAGITSTEINNWNTAYGRGNHRTMWYITGETDPVWNSEKTDYSTKSYVDDAVAGLAGGLTYRASWNYSTGALPSDITKGDLYIVHGSWDFNGLVLYEWDQMVANKTQTGSSSTGDRDIFSVHGLETDPIFLAHAASNVTNGKILNRDTAYGRGNHATQGYIQEEDDPIRSGDKANYYTKSAIDAKGYLTTYTETDPVFWASAANNVTNTKISHWDSAYSRGDHRLVGYLTGWSFANYYDKTQIDGFWFLTGASLANYYTISQVNAKWYITGYTETDPTVASYIKTITTGNINNRDTAFGRWNHSSAGYLTASVFTDYYDKTQIDGFWFLTGASLANYYTISQVDAKWYITGYTETDSVYLASAATGVTTTWIFDRNTAFGRWNHASAGYLTASALTSYYTKTQIDELWFLTGASLTNYYTKTQVDAKGYLTGETDPVWSADKTSYYNKSEVDSKLSSTAGMSYQWTWNYSTGVLPTNPLTWYFYVVSVAGSFNWLSLATGDMFIANKSVTGATATGDWDLIGVANTETDPIYSMSAAVNVTNGKISNWDTAYWRGNHNTMGYITWYAETDPVYLASAATGVTTTKITHWDSAYNRFITTGYSIIGFNTFACASGQIVKYNGSSRACAADTTWGTSLGDGYLTALSFATGNGLLTATVTGHSNITVNFDWRYALNSVLASYDLKTPWIIEVSSTSEFTGLKQAFDRLNANATHPYVVLLDAGSWDITNTITVNVAYPVALKWMGFEVTTLNASGWLANKPMFNVQSPFDVSDLNMDASTLAGYGVNTWEDWFKIVVANPGDFCQFQNMGIYNFNKGINIQSNAELWVFNSTLEDNVVNAVFISGWSYRSAETDYNNSPQGVVLYVWSGNFFSSEHDSYTVNTGQIGVTYYPTTYKNFTDLAIFNNNFKTQLSWVTLSGFDFSLARDANIEIYGNIGIEEMRPHAKINLYNGATSQAYTSNTWTKMNYTISDTYTKKRWITTTGRVTFLSDHEKSVQMWISASALTSTQTATVRFAIVKNGNTAVQYGSMEVTLDANNRAFNFSQNVYLDDVVKNDYYELYIYPVWANETITLQNLNRYIDSK